MLKLKDTPHDPIEALQALISSNLEVLLPLKKSPGPLHANGHQPYATVIVNSAKARSALERVKNIDEQLRKFCAENLIVRENESASAIAMKQTHALEAVASMELDGHFLDQEDEENFNRAALDDEDKARIHVLVSETRSLAQSSKVLREDQKRRISRHLAKIEDELLREKSRLDSFLSAAAAVSGLQKVVGEDLTPIAENIQKMRTITERKVTGIERIEGPSEPKRLPKPK